MMRDAVFTKAYPRAEVHGSRDKPQFRSLEFGQSRWGGHSSIAPVLGDRDARSLLATQSSWNSVLTPKFPQSPLLKK